MNIEDVNTGDLVTDGEAYAEVRDCVHGNAYYAFIGDDYDVEMIYNRDANKAILVADFHTAALTCCI